MNGIDQGSFNEGHLMMMMSKSDKEIKMRDQVLSYSTRGINKA